jgi:uncharacterized protein YdhG (YjbR/CyaY superfamily)
MIVMRKTRRPRHPVVDRRRGSHKEYIAGFSPSVRANLKRMLQTIRVAAPDAKETISYGIPAFKLNGPLIYFAGFKSHIGLYPMTATVRKHFKEELSEYLSGKATAKFPFGKPIPFSLIGKIVKFRVEENLDKANTRARRKWRALVTVMSVPWTPNT